MQRCLQLLGFAQISVRVHERMMYWNAVQCVRQFIRVPAQPFICSFLVAGHGIHELKARAMMMTAQQTPAAPVYATNSLQRCEKLISYVCILLKPQHV